MSEAEAATKPTEAVELPVVAEETKPTEDTTTATPTDADNGEASQILKTTAKIDHKDHKKNRKFDPSTQEETDDPDLIRKQVEFYFGDWNFPQDKFMWESCGGADNKPVAIAKLHTFKRMRRFQPYSAVVAALRDSTFLDVSGEEGSELVNRKVAYKPQSGTKAKAEASTVYVKGFGDESPDTQFDLESFFAQFGEVKGLKLRRTNENLFKGSVFVTFADEDTAKAFISKEPAPKWKEHDLKIMSKQAYCEEKSDMIRQGKLEPSSNSVKKFYEGNETGSRRPRDGDDWKKRRDHDQKHGFPDRRGGRGGRGRGGRGGRGGFRGDRRGPNDRNEEKRQEQAATTTENGDKTESVKRPREEDTNAEAPAAKKVDTKEETKTEA